MAVMVVAMVGVLSYVANLNQSPKSVCDQLQARCDVVMERTHGVQASVFCLSLQTQRVVDDGTGEACLGLAKIADDMLSRMDGSGNSADDDSVP
jgi:hypothetical protein